MGFSTYEKELLAIIQAVEKWKTYLFDHPFIIKTDHESLKYFLEQKITTTLQQKWLTKLWGLNYTIVYKRGKDNTVADALSRVYEDQGGCAAITVITGGWKDELQQSLQGDAEAQELISALCIDKQSVQPYAMKEGLLYHDGRMFVGKTGSLRAKVFKELHSSGVGGHSGVKATQKRVEMYFFWPSMKKDM